MNILVTGHLGFLGKNMSSFLSQQEGWHIDGYDWNPNEFPNVENYDWVVHLGAIADMSCRDVDSVMRQNLEFSQRLFTECNQHGTHLQYASSSSVYGNTKDFSETAPCYPQSPYAYSKYLFDRWVFQQEQHIMVQGFRYFNLYGKWMHLRGKRANVIFKWRQQARKEGKISVWEGAENIKRDWIMNSRLFVTKVFQVIFLLWKILLRGVKKRDILSDLLVVVLVAPYLLIAWTLLK